MRVLRVIYDLQVGGVQRMLLRVLPLLKERGVVTEVCCLREEGDLAATFRAQGFPVHVIGMTSRLDPRGLLRLRRLGQRLRCDVVHAHMYASNVAAALAFAGSGVRVLGSFHSQTPFSGSGQARMARWTAGLVHRFIAVSEAVRAPLLEAGLPAERVRVIHNGVDSPATPAAFPERPEGTPIHLVGISRFVKQKRVAMLLEVAVALRAAGVPFRLTLVGDGPQREGMERRAAEAGLGGDVVFAGWQSDVRPFVREADVYVSCSNREGFPNTVLEVMAEARAVVATEIPPNREVLGADPAGALLPDDLGEWVRVLGAMQRDRARLAALGRAAFDRVQEFTLQRAADKMLSLYREAR